MKESVHYLSEHLADARVVEIEGAAHWGPVLAAETVAGEIVRFFKTVA